MGPKWGSRRGDRGERVGTVLMTPHAMRYAWAGGLGEGSCDGTLARPYARGGYVAPGWPPPSRQGTEVPRRGVAGARVTRPFARAKRGPRNGVPPAAPRRATRKGLAPRSAPAGWGLRAAPRPFCRRPQQWGRPARQGPADGHTGAAGLHTHLVLATHNISEKKAIFFSIFPPSEAQAWPGGAPAAPDRGARRSATFSDDCAVGSG